MAGGSRKAHTKSRNGCGQCKKRRKKASPGTPDALVPSHAPARRAPARRGQSRRDAGTSCDFSDRRVQCDQRPPRCGNCVKWGVVCDYTALSQAVELASGHSMVRVASADTRYLPPPLPSDVFNAGDMELLRQYSNGTAITLGATDEWDLWQQHIPQEAKTYRYLMHAMFGLAALHISFIRPADRARYQRLAAHHHTQALSCFNGNVHKVTPKNASAVLSFTYFQCMYVAGIPVVSDFQGVPSPATAFVYDQLIGSRHAWRALGPSFGAILASPFGSLLKLKDEEFILAQRQQRSDTLFRYLYTYLETSPDGPELTQVYKDATDLLVELFNMLRTSPPRWNHASFWPCQISEEFFQLLLGQKMYPQVLLAHWVITLLKTPTFWFTIWARKIIEEVYHLVPAEHKYIIVWPAEEIGLIKREAHVEGCDCMVCLPHSIVGKWEGKLIEDMVFRKKKSVSPSPLDFPEFVNPSVPR